MKRLFYFLLIFCLIQFPSYSQEKPSVLNENIQEDIKQDTQEQIRLFYNTKNIKQCAQMLAKVPDTEKTAEDWMLMANIAQDNHKPLDAVFYLQRAILTDPKFYKPYYNIGNVYFSNDNINSAMDNYRKAIKLKSDFAYAYYNLACCYLKKENYRLARYYLKLAIKYNPEEPSFYYNIAYAYKKLNNEKRAEEALSFYNDLMGK